MVEIDENGILRIVQSILRDVTEDDIRSIFRWQYEIYMELIVNPYSLTHSLAPDLQLQVQQFSFIVVVIDHRNNHLFSIFNLLSFIFANLWFIWEIFELSILSSNSILATLSIIVNHFLSLSGGNKGKSFKKSYGRSIRSLSTYHFLFWT